MAENYVVVGGSSGIGLELVKRLVTRGHEVTVLSRSRGQLEGLEGARHSPVDVTTDELKPEHFPTECSGLVYCPGSINLRSFRSLKPDDFRQDFELNVMGAVKAIGAGLRSLRKSEQASVVLFSTVAVSQGMPMHASIAASKGALEGLTRTLAAEFAPEIRVNCVAPALTETPLTSKFFADPGRAAALAEKYPLGRTGTAEDIAAVSEFLLSKESSWITGQVIGVDGGMAAVRK